MAVVPAAAPSNQTQFFGALLVASLLLVGSAVVLTQRPVWMNGEEPSLGVLRPFTEAPAPPTVYTPNQLKAMATAGLNEGKGGTNPPAAAQSAGSTTEVAAPEEPLQEEGQETGEGTVHKDDRYVMVENAPGPKYPPTHEGQDLDVIQFGDYPVDTGVHTSKRLQEQDTTVPIRDVQMSVYPLLNLQDAGGVSDHDVPPQGGAITANAMFASALQANGLGDGKHIETVSGGLGANSEPPIDRIFDLIEGEHGAIRIDQGDASYWAMCIMIVLVLVGAIVILGYNLLPEGSFSKAWGNWKGGEEFTVEGEQGKWMRAYYDPPSHKNVPRAAPMTDVV